MGYNAQFQQYRWWAKKVTISHQGNHFQIGWLTIHPVFANHDDVISDFQELFGKVTHDIELNSKYKTRNFFCKDKVTEQEKEERLKLQVLTISVPSNITSQTTELLIKEWEETTKEAKRYNHL